MADTYGGQSSQDYRGLSGRVRVMYRSKHESLSLLMADGYTQTNPPGKVTLNQSHATSTTLSGITKVGVLGGSVAFTRPYAPGGVATGNYIGGPTRSAAAVAHDSPAPSADDARVRAVGLFLNDANGNDFENRAGVASGKAPYAMPGGMIAVQIYETGQQIQWDGHDDQAVAQVDIAWANGDLVYASVNGYVTNRVSDALEAYGKGNINHAGNGVEGSPVVTVLGTVRHAPVTAIPEVAFDVGFRFRTL